MSRVNMIQQAIKSLNGGQFQKMMDEYFSKRFDVYSIGSVFGDSNTKKGTPDALIRLDNNQYIFIEYTVQKENILNKIISDIESCLDKEKTNIEKKQIEKIIICTKITLDTKAINEIYSKAEKENVEIELLTGDLISWRLQDYPKIVKDYLGINLDTGQLLDIEDFVSLYNEGKLATPLDNKLYGREVEIQKVIQSIESGNITVLSGAPGVGKTQLALECIQKYNNRYREYTVKCFRHNGLNFYEDLETLFEKGKKYLLLIDDANQLTQLNLILDWLNRDDIELRLILTVRDYAKEKLMDKLNFFDTKEIEIGLLDDDIVEMICNEHGIRNQLYIERVVEIAKGNSRLVIMAIQVVIIEGKLSSLGNPGDLLDEYYKSVKSDFEKEFNSKDLLQIAAIIAFLGSVNLKDENNLKTISDHFGVKEERLWAGIERLHNMEVIDVYKNHVVKVSDQILNTYIFYYTVFEKRYLKYSAFIKAYYPNIKHRIIEHLNSIMFYYHETAYENIVDEINEVYIEVKETGRHYKDFIQTFWFALGTEPLIYAHEEIKRIDTEKIEKIDYDITKNSVGNSDLIDLLGFFSNSLYAREALELTFKYLEKEPSRFKIIYDSLVRNYGYEKDSSLYNYEKQRVFLQNIIDMCLSCDNTSKKMMLLRISQYFLKFDYDYAEAKGRRGAVFYNFSIEDNDNIHQIRNLAWSVLKSFSNDNLFKEDVNQALYDYGKQYSKNEDIDIIIRFDKEHILEILHEYDRIDLSASIAFGKINDMLSNKNLEFEESTKDLYETKDYLVLSVMTERLYELNRSNDEMRQIRKEKLKKLINFSSITDYQYIFELTRKVINLSIISDKYINNQSLSLILESAHPSVMKSALKTFFSYNLDVNLNSIQILRSYSKYLSIRELEEIVLTNNEYIYKDHWLYSVYYLESEIDINLDTLRKFYRLFENSNLKRFYNSIDVEFFNRFQKVDPEVFIKITRFVLNKEDETALKILETLFNPYITSAENLMELFQLELSTLKELYIKLYTTDQHIDYDGIYLKSIVQADISIIDDLFENLILRKIYHSDIKPLKVLWELDDWKIYINHYFQILLDYEETAYLERYIFNFFKTAAKGKEKIVNRQESWINETIIKYYESEKEILLLFKLISHLNEKQIIKAAKLLIEKNPSFNLFHKIQLEPNFFSWSGSEIPYLKRRRDFYMNLEKEIIGIRYLKHKAHLQKIIKYFDRRIEEVTIQEFMEDI